MTSLAASSDGGVDHFRIVTLRSGQDDVARTPLPVVADHQARDTDSGVVVRGLYCGRDHFNDPRARYCRTCGLAMAQASFVLLEGIRPPLGLLVFDSGESHLVSGDLVVGRAPLDHRLVRAGRARGLVLGGSDPAVSREHAALRLRDWDVTLADLGSTNGTFTWDAGARSWQQLVPDQAVSLQPGQRVAFGPRTAVFLSSLHGTRD